MEEIKKIIGKKPWRRWFRYQWLVQNIPFFLFLAVLAVLYIFNGHYSDNTIKNINKTSSELKELQFEYKTLKSEVMLRSKQSELARSVEKTGLKELREPPFVIYDSSALKE